VNVGTVLRGAVFFMRGLEKVVRNERGGVGLDWMVD
jgi:hypothetical protein